MIAMRPRRPTARVRCSLSFSTCAEDERKILGVEIGPEKLGERLADERLGLHAEPALVGAAREMTVLIGTPVREHARNRVHDRSKPVEPLAKLRNLFIRHSCDDASGGAGRVVRPAVEV